MASACALFLEGEEELYELEIMFWEYHPVIVLYGSQGLWKTDSKTFVVTADYHIYVLAGFSS